MKTRKVFWIALLVGGFVLSSCQKYDLDEKAPEGWGNSIYSWLDEQGNFTNTVRMINDLSYQEVLGKTGSKTLFVADDAAYERFFNNNSWGVKRYENLSLAQKKMLLFGNMIDNSIQLNSLSTIQGKPLKEGQAMRRFSALSEYDTIPVLKTQDMPDNKYWKRHRESGRDMVCMEDGSAVPMLLFLEAQLSNNRITNDDYNFLFNHMTDRQAGDASVNGINVVEDNIRCANGFIHRTGEVVTPLPNMAELIAKKPQVSLFNSLLERFCAPYPDGKDLAYVTVSILDKRGNLCPLDGSLLKFKVSGAGSYRASANGNPTCLDIFHGPRMHAFNGKLTVIVQSSQTPGRIRLKVSGRRLRTAKLSVNSAL